MSASKKRKAAAQKNPQWKNLAELQQTIKLHQQRYYIENRPTISDLEYDQLIEKLADLEKNLRQSNPDPESAPKISLAIGSDLTPNSNRFQHEIPILSLKNSYNLKEVLQWQQRWEGSTKTNTPRSKNPGSQSSFNILAQWKIDGATLVLYYRAGKLTHAVTRGSGGIGEEITENAKQIKGIPHQLDKAVDLIARGEVYMHFQDFIEINKTTQTAFLNPRNLAAGSLKQKDPLEVKKRRLRWTAFDCHFSDPNSQGIFVSDHSVLDEAKKLGIPTLEYQIFQSSQELEKGIAILERKKHKLLYPCDGLVLKINHLATRKILGSTRHSPRWAIAYKFDPEKAQTQVVDIEIQVGRTGRITPRAKLKPVAIGGSIIQYTTLHNDEFLDNLQVRVGSNVEISKRGDIIPAIERVITIGKGPIFKFPKDCPGCAKPLARKKNHPNHENLVGWYCINEDCSERMVTHLIFFAHRRQMDIQGLGEKAIRLFHRLQFLRSLSDIYRLHNYQDNLQKNPGFGPQSIQKIFLAIENSKKNSFSTFLVSLGLEDLGPAVVRLLLDAGYDSTKKILNFMESPTAKEDLQKIDGIGEKIATSLVQQFHSKKVQTLLMDMHQLGLPDKKIPSKKTKTSSFSKFTQEKTLAHQSWCITGSFEKFSSRKIIAETLVEMGARVVQSISKRTTHLLTGNKPSLAKVKKAEQLSLEKVSEQQFLSYFDQDTKTSQPRLPDL